MDKLEQQLREQLQGINDQLEPLMQFVLQYQVLQGQKQQVVRTLELLRQATVEELQKAAEPTLSSLHLLTPEEIENALSNGKEKG